MPLTYSIAEAVALTSVSRSTLYRAAKRGDLKAKRCGGRCLIDARSLHEFVGVDHVQPA